MISLLATNDHDYNHEYIQINKDHTIRNRVFEYDNDRIITYIKDTNSFHMLTNTKDKILLFTHLKCVILYNTITHDIIAFDNKFDVHNVRYVVTSTQHLVVTNHNNNTYYRYNKENNHTIFIDNNYIAIHPNGTSRYKIYPNIFTKTCNDFITYTIYVKNSNVLRPINDVKAEAHKKCCCIY